MKNILSTLALVTLLVSANVSAQEVKKTKTAKEKAKTEKSCSTAEKKSCSTEKKAACCAAKKA